MSDLTEMPDRPFQDALAAACFKGFPDSMAPFVALDVLDRTHAALRLMVVTATQSLEQAKRVGDADLQRRSRSFRSKVQKALAYVKPLVKQRNIAVNGNKNQPGTTNWRRLALDAVKLLETVVESESLPDDLHDRVVDLLDAWDGHEYAYKSSVDSRPYEERRASSLAGMAPEP